MMLLHNVPPEGQTRNSEWLYTSNVREGTDGIWHSKSQITRWAIGIP